MVSSGTQRGRPPALRPLLPVRLDEAVFATKEAAGQVCQARLKSRWQGLIQLSCCGRPRVGWRTAMMRRGANRDGWVGRMLRWSEWGDRIWRRVGTRARLIEGTVGTALRLLVRSATPSVWDFVAAGGVGGKEGFEPQRHRGHRVVTESAFIPFCDYSVPSVLLTFEITAACDEFPATCRGVRRVTMAPQHRKESSADVVRRCTQNTLMLPCGSKTVDHAFDIDGHALPASSHRRSRGPVPIGVFCVHRLAASAPKFLLCGAAGRCWRTHCQARVAAHASGATPWHCASMAPPFWLWPTAALRILC
jgi:hypothetical protein